MIVAGIDFPAGSVTGRARLLIANPAPLIVAAVIVNSVPPVFVSVTVLVRLDPIVVFSKAIGDGLGASVPIVTALPEADTEVNTSPFDPANEIVTAGLPAPVGENLTSNSTRCCGANTRGNVIPVTWNSEPNP